jgi:ribosomal protein S18 acetylase RimI-like enzyme
MVLRSRLVEAQKLGKDRGFRSTVLETGCDTAGAIALYESEGYLQIPEFPGCLGIPVSRCCIKRC